MRAVRIGSRVLGPDHPVCLVAEAGTTVNGNVETAMRVVSAAKAAGADFVKFMIIGADFIMSRRDAVYEYETVDGPRAENMYEMFKKLEFAPEQWRAIVAHCREVGIEWFATVDYVAGVDLAEELGAPAYKLSSWDVGNTPLIRRMARTGKPLLVDTGPAYLTDIHKLVDLARTEGNEQVILLHCTHSPDDAALNLRSIPYLQTVFGAPVGFSADERRTAPDIAALALGASMLEKRLSLDRSYAGHHHVKALEPGEFADYVAQIRQVERMLGRAQMVPSDEDLAMREHYFVSVVAERDIPAGTVLDESLLACKRPGTGIMPEHLALLTGRRLRRDVRRDELLSWQDV